MMKKDYQKFAKAIKGSRAEAKEASASCELGVQLGVELLASKIIIILQLDNPNFNYKVFKKACGYE